MKTNSDTQISRRQFLQTTAVVATAPYIIPASALGADGKAAPSERVNLAIIGVGGMGRGNLEACASFPDVVVTGVCDCNKARREQVVEKFKSTAKGHHDFRELLARTDVDAVIIASPPHWHTLMAIAAVEAGKDIYLQKPMTLYPAEGLAIRNAVRKHNRISQIGTQIHASDNYRRVVEWIRTGKLGPISVVRTFNVMNQGPKGIGHAPEEDVPPALDWDLWLGPAPKRRYNRLLASDAYNHCSFWDYSGGWTPGMAPHIIDLPYWALNLGVPKVTNCSGGRYVIKDDGDVPDVQEVLWQYGNMTMTWMGSICNSFAFDFGRGTPRRRLGMYFHGLNGTLFADYNKYEVVGEGEMLENTTPPPADIPPSPGHEREWIDCVKNRKQPSCNVEYHYKIDLAITLANLSYKLGQSISLDTSSGAKLTKSILNLSKGTPAYRSPWKFPWKYCKWVD